jgi:hypothetical protein
VTVEFLSDDQMYGQFPSGFTRGELERYFFLDDVDRGLVEAKRRPHNRLGFALQLMTVRYVGMFLDDPLQVPVELLNYLAEQLQIDDPSCVKSYGEREKTPFEHVWEIREVDNWHEFSTRADELGEWIEGRAWTTGDGPKALFDASVGWLRERRVLLPGVSTLARLVAGRREAATGRLWETLFSLLTDEQKVLLDGLLEVEEGRRYSRLDRTPVTAAADTGVRSGDDRRVGARGRDPQFGAGRAGCVGGAAAAAGGTVPLRDGGEGDAAAPALRLTPVGDTAGHRRVSADPRRG